MTAGRKLLNGISRWAAVHRTAERLSAAHTKAEGQRALDILHVSTALHLETKEFLSFDERQRKLAAAEGLAVKP
jgi:predicted nucleic acid-binding protein